MAITPKGIYYPEGSTNADFPSIFSTLASSIDSALGDFTYDSGWIDVPTSQMQNGWETYNTTGSRVRYRKVGKVVKLDGIARNGTSNDAFTLPVGFRPDSVYPNFAGTITGTGSNLNNTARVRVAANVGTVQLYVSTQTLRNLGVGLNAVSFFTD